MSEQTRTEALEAVAAARVCLAKSQATAEEVTELINELRDLNTDPRVIALLRGAFLIRTQ